MSADRQIARAAVTVMGAFVISNVVGLSKWVLVSRTFGTSAQMDAFNAANRLPEILFTLMAGGALASAFVPVFTGFLTRSDRENAWRLASSIANLVFVGLSLSAAISWLIAPWLVRNILAPYFTDPAQISLTVSLLRVLLISAVIFGLSGLLMGVLNAHQHFLLPALAPTFFWLGWIVGVALFAPMMGIHGLAWGVVLGALMHLLIQLPGLRGRSARYHFGFGLKHPTVRRVGYLMAPRLVGVGVVQLNFLVNTVLASGMPEGSLTGITIAFAVMMMPQVIIAQAIGIAVLPTFSAQVARNELVEMRTSLATTLRGVLFLSLPASVGLIILRRPIVSLLFQRGAFDARSTELVAWALLWYAAGLVGHSLLEIIARAFYAMQDTRTPVVIGAAAMALNVIFSIAFSTMFAQSGRAPHGGLALANSLATALECLALLLLLSRRVGGLDLGRIRRGALATLAGTALMGSALIAWLGITSTGQVWLVGLGGVALGGAIYWLACLMLGAPEARLLPRLLLRKLV
ncbi:MAG TPA: murein biosynthesis integral membrane protein MurJ [Anaerolineales bacterium]|nr:murein biosynthesis integral membrane protein MurJ [Anaerolineales bacterium]